MTTTYRRWGGFVVLAAVSAIVLAGCGGGSKAPSVANIATTSTPTTVAGKSSGTSSRSSTSTVAKGNATGLLVEWAACMRSHGDPNQAAPTVDVHGGINVIIPLGAPQALSNEVHGGTAPCNDYLVAASNALRAADPAPPPPSNEATGVEYAACMRSNGVPNYPDPKGNQTDFNGTGVDPNSPFFQRANKVCGEKIGAPAWWINGWGPPGNISVTSGPQGHPPPGGPQSTGGAPTTPGALTSG